MRLAELRVEGFGILNNLFLDGEDLLKNITVIYGPNEAGKSTLMSFILAVLFGFKSRGGRFGEPLRGGRQGGSLVFTDAGGGRYRVERILRGRQGRVTVTLPDGTAGDETLLKSRVLHGVTPLVYRNVFAFGVEELHRLEELGTGEIGVHVYGAGAGIRAGRLTGALDRLRGELDGLFRPGGSRPEINRLLRELEGSEAAVRQLQREPDLYGELRREAAALRAKRRELEECRQEVELRLGWLEKVRRATETWARLQEAKSRLESLDDVPCFPEGGVARLQALEDRLRDQTQELAEEANRISLYEERLAKIEVDRELLGRAREIRALEEERGIQQERLRRLPELAGDARRAGELFQKHLQKLGCSGEGLLDSLDTSLASRAVAEEFRVRSIRQEAGLQEAKAALAGAERTVEDKEEDLRRAERELADCKPPASPAARPLEVRESALDTLEAGLGRLAGLSSRLENLRGLQRERQRSAAAAERERGETPRPLPRWFSYALLVALAGLAAAAFSMGMVQGLAVLLAGGVTAALVLLAGRRSEAATRERCSRLEEHLKELSSRLEEGAAEIERLAREEAALREELGAAAKVALGRPDFTGEDIPAAKRALEEEKRFFASLEMLKREVARTGEALARERHRLRECGKAVEAAGAALAETGREWRAWLEERGLPPSLTPPGALPYFEAVEEARRLKDAWQRAAGLENETRERSEGFLGALNSLLELLGRAPVAREGACAMVDRLAGDLREAVRLVGEKERLEKDLEELRGRRQAREKALKTLEKEIVELLAEGGAADAGEFRRRARLYNEGKNIKEEIRSCQREISIIAGSPGARAALEKDLAEMDGSACDVELKKLKKKINEFTEEIREDGERIGGLENRLGEMEKGEELAARLQEREILLNDLRGKAGEWQVRALCLHLLKLARERHERQRQPAVLRRASGYLGPMTGGVYSRVIAPVGRTDLLEVETPQGDRVAAADLSRGAAAQLYLSVRLALARQYDGVTLPVILDDVLVDFDPARLKGAARVLNEFGRDRQVLLFTCHRHVLEALTRSLDDFGLVRLQNGLKRGDIHAASAAP